MSGSRNAPVSSILLARRFTWVGDKSRWNGVGWTAPSGSDAIMMARPPSGSRYAPIGAPPASTISAARSATSGWSVAIGTSAAARPRGLRPGASLPREVLVFFDAAPDLAREVFFAAMVLSYHGIPAQLRRSPRQSRRLSPLQPPG